MTALAAAAASYKALAHLKDRGEGTCPDVPLFDFKRFCQLIGFEEVWAFERKWASPSLND